MNRHLRSSAMALCLLACTSASAQQNDRNMPTMEGQQVGQQFRVMMESLPPPYRGPAVRNSPLIVERAGRMPNLPAGFVATLYADNLDHPRQIMILPNGDAVVVMQEAGHIVMMRDSDGDGRADWIERHAAGFNAPYGVAYREGEILVADQDGIWTIAYTPGSLRPPFASARRIETVPVADRRSGEFMDGQTLLTARGVFGIAQGHYNRDLEIGRDGTLFVGVGSAGNIGVEPRPKSTIQAFASDGSRQRTLSSGMRNPSGLAIHPQTGELWAVVQERDGIGDELVPDFMTRVRDGGFYGFPYSYIGTNRQPGFANLAPANIGEAIVPDLLLQPHSAAMDLTFYDGPMFPAAYRGDAFIALKGSWNRSTPTGYSVVRVRMSNGRPTGTYENFMTGFWVGGSETAEVWGRPVDVATAPDGALFVVDESGGTIWRVTYTGD